MTPRLLTTQGAAERLGLTPGSLQKLRWQDDGLPIFQQGLDVHYRLEDLEAFEQREVRTLLKQVLQHERPLPLIRSIARSFDLAINTQGVESDLAVFKPAVRLVSGSPQGTARSHSHNLQRQNFRWYMPMHNVEKVFRGKPLAGGGENIPKYAPN